jgi:hypothetical protein
MIQRSINESLNVNDYPAWMFKRSSFKEFELSGIEPDSDKQKETEREHLILCRFCGNNITSPAEIIEINCKHNHSFTNPAGNTFTIGCFLTAKGCLNYGEPTTEYTWFPGFTWSYAICSDCNSHLGWFYKSQNNSFYGLILKNLAENL